MAHFLAIKNRKPNAAQKSAIKKVLRDIGSECGDKLSIGGGSPGEQAFYVEAPDYWSDSYMKKWSDMVRDAVTQIMGAE